MTDRRVVVYGDVDLNYIDGSSVWLISLCSVLERIEGADVELILKAPVQRDILTAELGDGIRVHEPNKRRTHREVLELVSDIDATDPFDVLIIRGRRLAHEIVQDVRFAARTWAYLTDVPQTPADLDSPEGDELRAVLSGSARLLCQTEDMRAWFVSVDPAADAKLLLLAPMVPDDAFRPKKRAWVADGLKLLYAGKFAPDWGFVEVVEEVSRLRGAGIDVSLVVAGDKIHDPPDDPTFARSVREALAADFVDWRGGVSRSEVFRLLEGTDLALSVRTNALDDSRELSTKLLEYSAAGVPVIANRTRPHVELFGEEYPFLVSGFENLSAVVESVLVRPDLLDWASKLVRELAESFSFHNVAASLAMALEQVPPRRRTAASHPTRLLVAGHDLKFVEPLIQGWKAEGIDVSIDPWQGHNRHDPQASRQHLADADIVLCEWMLGNSDFYARNAPAGVPVIVRLHRMEVTTEWPTKVPLERVDHIVTVSDHIKAEVTDRFGFPTSKVVVIPNGVDWVVYDRPKLAGARYTLGMLGYLPRLKRIDRAIELLRRLREVDPRYRLVVKGRRPEDVGWIWENTDERSYYEAVLDELCDSDLADAVVIEPAGPDTPSWFRKIGYILSPSELESFHLAMVEGMASAAVPVAWERMGAHDLIDSGWVHASTEEAAEWILRTRDWTDQGNEASEFVRARYGAHLVQADWERLIDSTLLGRSNGTVAPVGKEVRRTSPPYGHLVASDLVADPDSPGAHLVASARPSLRVPYRYQNLSPSEQDQVRVAAILEGLFQPSPLFDPVEVGMPPDWVSNPYENRTWDFHRHSLEWLEPVIRVAREDGSVRRTLEAIVASWIESNSRPPGATPYVWNDHTAAIRTRVLLFLLHVLDEVLGDETRLLVQASVIQHGAYIADERHYTPNSNHGLEMDASLLALAVSLPQFRYSSQWKAMAETRLEAYVARNYSRRFVHLEQSPAYHLFVTVRLMSLISFLKDNGAEVPGYLERAVRGASAVWPHMRRPDRSVPMIGDTPRFPKPTEFDSVHERLLGYAPRSVAPEGILNPRDDSATAFVDPEGGYAIYADDSPKPTPLGDERQFHVTVKCNTFESPHYHHDAGSLVVWFAGLDWIVDSGYYSMEERTAERQYMRSARAHNVLLVDDEDFGFQPFAVTDVFRSKAGDGIAMFHALGPVLHRRHITVDAARKAVVIRDHVCTTDDEAHQITRLLHLHPQLRLDVRGPDRIEAWDPHDRHLVITHSGSGKANLSMQAGDDSQGAVGWYSEEYMNRQPAPVLRWNSVVGSESEWEVRLHFK